MDTVLDLELLGHVGNPSGTETFPGHHLRGSFTQQGPHRHFKGTCVGGGHDADPIIGRHAQNFAGCFDRLLQLGLAGCGTMRAPQRCVGQLAQVECGGFGTGAGGKTRIERSRLGFAHARDGRRFLSSHLCYPSR